MTGDGEGACPAGTALEMRYVDPAVGQYADQFEALQDGDELGVVHQAANGSWWLSVEYRVLNPGERYREQWFIVSRDGQDLYTDFSGATTLAPDPRWPCYETASAGGYLGGDEERSSVLTEAPVDILLRIVEDDGVSSVEQTVRNVSLVASGS